jgi:hypothetical protein
MLKAVKEAMCHMNKYSWNSVETEKNGLELGEQQWDETQQHNRARLTSTMDRCSEQRLKQQRA